MIAMRADMNDQIGTGHMTRCIAIASAIRKTGTDVLFICADEVGKKFAERNKFEALSLDTRWDDLETELGKIFHIIRDRKPETLLTDSYYATPTYFEGLCGHIRTAFLDDGLYHDKYPVNILINYNIYCDTMNYRTLYSGTGTKLILGPAYAPLRAEYLNLPRFTVKDVVTDVLVSTGGTDIANLSIGFSQNIAARPEYSSITFHLAVGELNSHLTELHMLEKNLPNVRIHSNVKNMSALIRSCDVAVSASGTTLYELCACGIPTITYVLADNQLLALDEFSKRSLMLGAGDCRLGKSNFYTVVCRQLDRFISSKGLRNELSRNSQHEVDGEGSERLAVELCSGILNE